MHRLTYETPCAEAFTVLIEVILTYPDNNPQLPGSPEEEGGDY